MRPNRGRKDVEIGVCGDGDSVGGMVVVIFSCSFEANAVQTAVDIVLWRNHFKKLNEGELLGVSFGKMEEFCVKRRGKTSLETQPTER